MDESVHTECPICGSGDVGDTTKASSDKASAAAYIVQALMTNISNSEYSGEYAGCQTPPEITTFLDTDYMVRPWVHYKNGVGATYQEKWYIPNGDLSWTSPSGDEISIDHGCRLGGMYILGHKAANYPGQWKVEVYLNGVNEKTLYFTIKATTPTPIDTTSPTVTITSPTSRDTYTATSSPLKLSGSASDSASGVKEVTWSNNKGGSGTASGTTSWSIPNISLKKGKNKITVTAKDKAGNTSTDTITVTYQRKSSAEEPHSLATGDYSMYTKNGYSTQNQDISHDEDESEEIEPVAIVIEQKGKIYGNMVTTKGDPIESVKLKLQNVKTKTVKRTASDVDGFYEFKDIDATSYEISAKKRGYKSIKKPVTLEDGDDQEVEIEMKKTTKRVGE